MGLSQERRKEIERSLSLAETELRIVNDDPSASGIHVAMVHGRYFAAWNAAVIELLAALAEAKRDAENAQRDLGDALEENARLWVEMEGVANALELQAEICREINYPATEAQIRQERTGVAGFCEHFAESIRTALSQRANAGCYLTSKQVQQVREAIQVTLYYPNVRVSLGSEVCERLDASLSLLGGGDEVVR